MTTTTGVLSGKHRRALDSTILDDAVATQDTVTQLIAAIRKVRRSVREAVRVTLSTASDEGGKPVIDWSDTTARDSLVTGLVHDAEAVLAATEQAHLSKEAADAIGLLALVSGQDAEPGEKEGSWRIARKVAKDRVISTVDRDARHGHKSRAVRVDGFKAHLVLEPDTGIVTAALITAANTPDGPTGVGLMAAQSKPDQSVPVEVLADSAYGSGATREALRGHGHLLVIKPMPTHPAVRGGFVRDDFTVDHDARTVTCPAGHLARLSAGGVAKFTPHCRGCPLRPRCSKAAIRSFSVRPHDAELVAAREAWRDEEVRAAYRQQRHRLRIRRAPLLPARPESDRPIRGPFRAGRVEDRSEHSVRLGRKRHRTHS